MRITAWRIFKAKLARSAFSGEGAETFGGRWNSKGTALVYIAGSPSLAVLELLVHLTNPEIMEVYDLCDVSFEESLIQRLSPKDLPKHWRSYPPLPELAQIGDDWAARKASAVLRVPSAIIDVESNYLLNPAHVDFARIKIGRRRRFRFDSRLLR